MRNNLWLTNRLIYIWKTYFSDIYDGNELKIQFGRYSKTRLGSIAIREKGMEKKRLEKSKFKRLEPDKLISIIVINKYFQDPKIPEEVVDSIIAHEFCHFVHGFNSARQKFFRYPHHGGIINRELKQRGLEKVLKIQKKWIKENWKDKIKNPGI